MKRVVEMVFKPKVSMIECFYILGYRYLNWRLESNDWLDGFIAKCLNGRQVECLYGWSWRNGYSKRSMVRYFYILYMSYCLLRFAW